MKTIGQKISIFNLRKLALIGFSFLASGLALASNEYLSQELSCRAKAKEVAAESYKGCVTEFKNAELDRLHKSYQKKLKALKDNYEKEVETLSGEQTPAVKTKVRKSAKSNRTQSEDVIEAKAQAPQESTAPDESKMDLPEPVPVEN